MKISRSKMTDPGCGGRENQDWVWCKYNTYRGKMMLLAVVCDGVGGVLDGAYASRRTLDYIIGGFWAHLDQYEKDGVNGDELARKLCDVIFHSNESIYRKSRRNNRTAGTTVGIFLMVDHHYYIMNVGDSRIYWKTSCGLYRTVDQTLFEEKKRNHVTPCEQDSHVLMQSVGSQAELHVDFYDGEIKVPMSVMLMTDGAYRPFMPQEINDFMKSGDVMGLKKQAIKRKEQDNLSCIWLGIS